MDAKRLAEIRAREEAASPAPWAVEWANATSGDVTGPLPEEVVHSDLGGRARYAREDATFIAHARTDVPDLLAEVEALKSTLATLSEEKAQEVERRLRAEEESEALRETALTEAKNQLARALRAEAERDEAKSAAVESYDMFQRERVRAERAEADRDNALALKRAAYDVLDGCRTVVEKTIIPALEYIGGGGGRPGVDLKREALAAAWKLLEDWAMDAPTDLYELLAALAPKGWRESFGPEFGLYLPPEKGGPKWIRQDGPGRVVMYGSGMLALGPSLLVPMELGAVVPFLRERGAM
jgi:hypothetical protein